MKTETLEWLASSNRFTKRFEIEIGKMCREMSIKRVAALNRLSWDQVRRMEIVYMKSLVAKNPPSKKLRAIGIDEISIKKRHKYAIVVADLEQKRPIWIGMEGRKEEHLDAFFTEIGPKISKKIDIAVMDMWKPFRKSTRTNAPQTQIIYDKFHILNHLNKALDAVRRTEYKRVQGPERKFIKGQRYTLLSNKANLDVKGKNALNLLLKANKRIHKAYLLKETFGQLWNYQTETWCLKFFNNWKEQLKWSRLEPYKKFVTMIEKHWENIVSYCNPENKVSLGFMEGMNNKIRVIQRRAYGLQNQEYFRLKVLTSFLKD